MHRTSATVQLAIGGRPPLMITADPDFAQYILLKNRDNYQKTSESFGVIRHFYGNGLLNSEGAYWKKQRKMIQPGFGRARLKQVLVYMEQVTEAYLEEVDQAILLNPQVTMCDLMLELTFKVIANAIFSTNLSKKEFRRINQIMPQVQAFIMKMIVKPYLQWWHKCSGQVKAHEVLSQEQREIVRSYIQKRRAEKGDYDDLLQMLMDIRYEDTGAGMTDAQLIDEINILFLAGHDTSAKGLSWAWYLLTQHPEVLKKVREEVADNIPDGQITFDRLTSLTYTQQVLEETLRLYPPIYGTNRMAVEDDEFKGIKIKKGTTCGTYIYGLHHSPALWHEPETFDPDRFAKSRKKERHSFAFLPFGGGPRFCVGRQFALMEMKMVLAKMVMRYDFDLLPDQKIEPVALINLQPKNGIKMKLSLRKQAKRATSVERNVSRDRELEEIPLGSGCPFAAAMSAVKQVAHI